jgi:CheY-like chemotaxis protein
MEAEVLIVGEPATRTVLARQAAALGYEVELVPPGGACDRIAEGVLPRVVVVCIADVDPPDFMTSLRRVQRGAAVPVTLYGSLGGTVLDLADVLDLGADHFLEEPVADDQLASALEALAGPPNSDPVRDRPEASVAEVSWPTSTSVIDEPEPRSRAASEGSARTSDPVIGQLTRTLDFLADRRKKGDDEADDLDLASLGFEGVPELDADHESLDPAESQDRLEVAELRVLHPPAPTGTGSGSERRGRASIGPRESTVLLEDSSPLPPRPMQVADPIPEQGTSPGRERTAPVVAVTSEVADRPRRRVPLPLERDGDLSTIEVARLLSKLARSRFTGRLSLAAGRVEKSMWFDGGAIVYARSTAGHDRLIDGLVRRGLVTRAQYDDARRAIESAPRRAGQVLVEAGFLKQSELVSALQDHLARIVDSTFGWHEGSWALEPDVRCDEPVLLQIPTAALIVEGIRQRLEPAQLWGLVGGPRAHPRLRDGAAGNDTARRELAEGLQLGPTETEWLAQFDGRQALADLLADPDAKEDELLPLVHALHVLELLDLHREALPMPRVADDPASVDKRRLEDRLTLAREADYFALLGLPRDAGRADVRHAYTELMRTFGEGWLEESTREAMQSELHELRAALGEARDVLQDDALRSAYLAQLEDP